MVNHLCINWQYIYYWQLDVYLGSKRVYMSLRVCAYRKCVYMCISVVSVSANMCALTSVCQIEPYRGVGG